MSELTHDERMLLEFFSTRHLNDPLPEEIEVIALVLCGRGLLERVPMRPDGRTYALTDAGRLTIIASLVGTATPTPAPSPPDPGAAAPA